MNEIDEEKSIENCNKMLTDLFNLVKDYPVFDSVRVCVTYLTYACYIQQNSEIRLKSVKEMMDKSFSELMKDKEKD